MSKKAGIFNNNQLLPKFVIAYITYYFFYGYLCLAGACVLTFALIFLFRTVQGCGKYAALILIVPIAYAFIRFLLILGGTRYKWRFYRLTNYRLRTRGFNEAYFKYEMYEPCMRLITKKMLYEYGYQAEYKEMLGKYIKVNQRVEDAKNRLLESVMHDDEKNLSKGG